MDGTRRTSTGPAVLVALMVLIGVLASPAGAAAPLARTDVAAFSNRAAAWIDARDEYRDDAHQQARVLAEAARTAQAAQLAVAEAAQAEQDAAQEAARTTTTTAAPTTTTTRAPATTTTSAAPPIATTGAGEPTAGQLAALRGCEASGNYAAVSANTRYRGAYQFSQATWDWIAGIAAPSLVGTDPAGASPADQDAMAVALWRQRGWSPWPHCGAQAAAS